MSGPLIHAGAELKNNSAPGPVTYLEDTFDTPANISTYVLFSGGAGGTWSISGSKLNVTAGAIQNALYRGDMTPAVDTWVEVILTQANDSGLVLRVISGVGDYYLLTIQDSAAGTGPNTVTFFKRVGGVFTSLGVFPIVFVNGTAQTFRFQAVGNNLTAFQNGTLIGGVVDTAIMKAGFVGVRSNQNANSYDNLRWSPSNMPAYDPFWHYVACLLKFNGGNNTTVFKDEKDHLLPWSRTGTGVLSTAQAKFGMSSYLSATASYLRATGNEPEWDAYGNDFTVEGWAYATSANATGILCCQTDPAGAVSTAERGIVVSCPGNGTINAHVSSATGVASANITGGAVPVNTWFHWAFTRSASTFTLFLNGVIVSTATSASVLPYGTGMTIGGDPSTTGALSWIGYIESFRYTVGVCRYTTAFTPPVADFPAVGSPYDAVPVPKLASLLRMNGAPGAVASIYDETGKAWAVNAAGMTYGAYTHRFGQTAMNFSGAGNYIETPQHADFAFGTNPWTIEFWQNTLVWVPDNKTRAWIDLRPAGTGTSGLAIGTNGAGQLQVVYNNVIYGAAGVNIGNASWAHTQVCYDGRMLYAFYNGALQWAVAVQIFVPPSKLRIGADVTGANGFQGTMDEVRVVAGMCNNIISFSPPQEPLRSDPSFYDPLWNNTTVLASFSGANNAQPTADDKGRAYNWANDAKVATVTDIASWSSPGSGALRLDGASDYAYIPGTILDLIFNQNDFTIELWFKTGLAKEQVLLDHAILAGSNYSWYFEINASGFLSFYIRNAGTGSFVATGTTVVWNNQWHHVAVTRSGTAMAIWLDGNQEKTVTTTLVNLFTQVNYFAIGAMVNSRNTAFDFRGFIKNVRITNGVRRYTTTFMVPWYGMPTLAYDYDPNPAQVITLLRFDGPGNLNGKIYDETGRFWLRSGSPVGTVENARFGGSLKCPGGSVHLYAPSGPEWNWGVGDFTIEASVCLTSYVTSGIIIAKLTGLTSAVWAFGFDGSTGQKLTFTRFNTSYAATLSLTAPTALALNTWYDVSVQRNGATGDHELRINGVVVATGNDDSFDTVTSDFVRVGGTDAGFGLVGYIDELRVSYAASGGRRRYFGATGARNERFPRIVPPTEPYYDQTLLQLHADSANQNTIFIDSSVYNRVPSAILNWSLDQTKARFGYGCFAKSLSAGYITYNNVANMDIGTSDFTIEMWIYRTSVGTQVTLFDTRPTAGSALGVLGVDSNNAFYWYSTNAFRLQSAAGQSTANVWQYVAVCRSAGVDRLFLNGVNMATAYTDSQSYTGVVITIGNDIAGSTGFIGSMDEIRYSAGNGAGKYGAAFSPPTRPFFLNGYLEDPQQQRKTIALHFDGANGAITFGDPIIGANWTRVNAPTISTAQSVFGGSSGRFTNVDAITANSSGYYDLGASDFTLRFWLRFNTLGTGNRYIVSKSTNANTPYTFVLSLNENNKIQVSFYNTSSVFMFFIESKTVMATGAWVHVEVTRAGDTFRLFINGVNHASYTLPSNAVKAVYYSASDKFVIGAQSNGTSGFDGWIDELQLYIGTAVDTKDFQLPFYAAPDSSM